MNYSFHMPGPFEGSFEQHKIKVSLGEGQLPHLIEIDHDVFMYLQAVVHNKLAEERRREDRRRKQEEEELRRKINDERNQWKRSGTTAGGAYFTFDYDFLSDFLRDLGGIKFDGMDDGFRTTPRTEHKTSTPPPRQAKPAPKVWNKTTIRIRLREIAEVTDVMLEDKKLIARAKRKAHPDSGGSHDLFIEVTELVSYLGK